MNTNIHLNRPKWRLAAKHYKLNKTIYGNSRTDK